MARHQSRGSRRGRNGYRERTVDSREIVQRFLIVCEGAKTEPHYFQRFRVPSVVIDVQGLGLSPLQLVDEAVRLRQEAANDEYDQVWCVFDRDDWPVDNFNGALDSARQRNVQVAWSNEAFELWYLLHFDYHDTAIPRSEYMARLTTHLGKPYAKNSRDTYADLEGQIETALRNAERLLAQYNPPNPAADKPCTTVHLLVQQLRRFSP